MRGAAHGMQQTRYCQVQTLSLRQDESRRPEVLAGLEVSLRPRRRRHQPHHPCRRPRRPCQLLRRPLGFPQDEGVLRCLSGLLSAILPVAQRASNLLRAAQSGPSCSSPAWTREER
eukprot:scaffold40197_cov33-Tisochrysis_lutea.AAC.3